MSQSNAVCLGSFYLKLGIALGDIRGIIFITIFMKNYANIS